MNFDLLIGIYAKFLNWNGLDIAFEIDVKTDGVASSEGVVEF